MDAADPSGKTLYFVNDHLFDPNYVPITMKLGSVEQWTLVNTDTEWHTFHIHQNPFQVISLNGRPLNYVDYQDNVSMPPRSRIVIRMRPLDFTWQVRLPLPSRISRGQRHDDGGAGCRPSHALAAAGLDGRSPWDRRQLERI